MLSFTQINLHKATQATMVLGAGLGGCKQKVVLMTEPYTYDGKIAGIPRGTKLIHARNLTGGQAPRAGIVASLDVNMTAMDTWCNRDCAVALARVGGKPTVVVSMYMDINLSLIHI